MKFSSLIMVVCSIFLSTAYAQSLTEPGGSNEDSGRALRNPDEYAWQLFLHLNRPARIGVAGQADPGKKFGDTSGPLVWETWALSSGDHAGLSETYPKDGAKPIAWEQLPRSSVRKLILEPNRKRIAVQQELQRNSSAAVAKFFPPLPDEQEVRANKSTYDFIVKNEMYHLGGLEKLLDSARKSGNRQLISFEPEAKEIKAQWKEIDEKQKPRYLWRETVVNGSTKIFGLVSFHVITKDLPNWFWSDFGHVDCENRENACSQPDQELALTKPIDRTTRGLQAPSGKDGVRKETVGTVFANYILRGTQIDFVTPQGAPTILSNPVIENTFQQSSCMTCHARASIGPRQIGADGKPVKGVNRLNPGSNFIGVPNSAIFGVGGEFSREEIEYLQTDFIWSASFRASRRP
jgi:hypothetical protein